MSPKLADYDFRGVPQQVRDYLDDIRDVINFGKIQINVVSGTPTYAAGSGEFSLTLANGSGTLYVYTGSAFSRITSFPI